jgi:hypothetical protein
MLALGGTIWAMLRMLFDLITLLAHLLIILHWDAGAGVCLGNLPESFAVCYCILPGRH